MGSKLNCIHFRWTSLPSRWSSTRSWVDSVHSWDSPALPFNGLLVWDRDRHYRYVVTGCLPFCTAIFCNQWREETFRRTSIWEIVLKDWTKTGGGFHSRILLRLLGLFAQIAWTIYLKMSSPKIDEPSSLPNHSPVQPPSNILQKRVEMVTGSHKKPQKYSFNKRGAGSR